MNDGVAVNRHEVVALCLAALDAVGADRRVAELLTETALFAEDRGRAVVGVAHLLDHVDAMADGRLDGRAVPFWGIPLPPSPRPMPAAGSHRPASTGRSPAW